MYRFGGMALAVLVLSGCASQPPNTGNDTAICLAALVSAGVNGGIGSIPAVALATPACQALAADVLAQLIQQATGNAAAVRRTLKR